MLIETSALWDFRIFAVDGETGRISDLQVDDRRWTVADIVVSVGHWPADQLVILPPARVAGTDTIHRAIRVGLTAAEIADAPSVATHPSVSLQRRVATYQYDLPRQAIIHAADYQPGKPPDADYEARLHGWYGPDP